MFARIETPTADARLSAASDSGKGRSGQDKSDAFGGLLAEYGGTKAVADTDGAGALTMNTTSLALTGAAATGKAADSATPDAAQSLSGKLFQSLVEGTAATNTQAKADSAEDEAKPAHARDLEADPAVVAMLAMPALAAAIAPVSTNAPPAAASTKGASSSVASITADAADDHVVSTASTGDTPSISDVSIETHIAVAASPAVPAGDLGDAAHQAETKLEPVLSADALQPMAAPTRSVAQAVGELLPQNAAPAQAADPAPPSLAPARTMTLQLNPADLGTVHVRLHLTGQALDLQLSVSSKETLGAISRDRTHLETALAGQSYDLRSLVIQGADGAGAATTGDPQTGANGQGAAAQGGQSDGGQSDRGQNRSTSASGNGAGGSGGERRATQSRGHSTDEAARAPGASRAGALFV